MSGPASLDPGIVVSIVIAVGGIYFRRRRPLMTVAASGAVIIASIWAPGEGVLAPAVFAVYVTPVYRSARAGWITAACIAIAGSGAAIVKWFGTVPAFTNPVQPTANATIAAAQSVIPFTIQFSSILALALLLGINVGNRRRYLSALIDRARQLAVERDQQSQIAIAAERARIAREMHDIVSHSLTVMITLAEGSAIVADKTAPKLASAMRDASQTGRTAMIDMRRMLGVLGGDPLADHAPQPGYADIPDLLDRYSSLGLPINYHDDGIASADPAVQLAVYRLVQEALTNTLRYAHGPTHVDVRATAHGGSLTVTVTDDGLPGFPNPPSGAGRGLLGLRERLTALEATLEVGPRQNSHGWKVEAIIPLFPKEANAS